MHSFKHFPLINLSLFFLMSFSTTAQELDLKGKTFSAKEGETCKMMSDGGCSIHYYRLLQFVGDTVLVSRKIEALCSPEFLAERYETRDDQTTQKHKWMFVNGTICIEGFTEFELIPNHSNQLTAVGNMNGTKEERLFFEEVK
ncbi:MAG: hypothetical protein QE487_02960 [Fluviicola sp.]|nr:hypothetical protein [Fluviicola sp.]